MSQLSYKNDLIELQIDYIEPHIDYLDDSWKNVLVQTDLLNTMIPVEKITATQVSPQHFEFEVKFVDGRKWIQTWEIVGNLHQNPLVGVSAGAFTMFLDQVRQIQLVRAAILTLNELYQINSIVVKYPQ